jgi:hypothetical protein
MITAHVEPHPATVRTTKTSGGRLLDWIPIESQVAGGNVATPPPSLPTKRSVSADAPAQYAGFELDDPRVERGPQGTVPVLRDLVSHRERVQRRGIDKKGPRMGAIHEPDPSRFGYYHAVSRQKGTFFGGLSDTTIYTPTLQSGEDHSLYQMWLVGGGTQSVEAGWTVDPVLNGDLNPHLFTFFTTNGWAGRGDNLGGYNAFQAGWVQINATGAYPGVELVTSRIDHQVNRYDMLFMLWQDNWWFKLESIWVGYYPTSLFGTGAMARNASQMDFGGEVYSDLSDPATTTTQMGSGRKGEHGSDGYSAWQRNIQAITSIDATGGWAVDFNGTPIAEDTSRYDIVQTMRSSTNWGSFLFAGGPGIGTEP